MLGEAKRLMDASMGLDTTEIVVRIPGRKRRRKRKGPTHLK